MREALTFWSTNIDAFVLQMSNCSLIHVGLIYSVSDWGNIEPRSIYSRAHSPLRDKTLVNGINSLLTLPIGINNRTGGVLQPWMDTSLEESNCIQKAIFSPVLICFLCVKMSPSRYFIYFRNLRSSYFSIITWIWFSTECMHPL